MTQPNYYDYSQPADGEFRIRPASRGWIVTAYSYMAPKSDPVLDEAIEKLRSTQGSWDSESAVGAASDLLHAKTGYGAYLSNSKLLVKTEAVFERGEDLAAYLSELADKGQREGKVL